MEQHSISLVEVLERQFGTLGHPQIPTIIIQSYMDATPWMTRLSYLWGANSHDKPATTCSAFTMVRQALGSLPSLAIPYPLGQVDMAARRPLSLKGHVHLAAYGLSWWRTLAVCGWGLLADSMRFLKRDGGPHHLSCPAPAKSKISGRRYAAVASS